MALSSEESYSSNYVIPSLLNPSDDPVLKDEYPSKWTSWEDELLAPLLSEDPGDIDYVSYEVIDSKAGR